MASTQLEVIWEQGLDLHTAALLVILASHFKSRIWLRANRRVARATDTSELIALRLAHGTPVDLWAEGSDEDWANKALVEFFTRDIPTLTDAVEVVSKVRMIANKAAA